MSPEQAKGKPVDKRADIWAFGCVLYECVTGKRTFEGETITEVVASILKSEPDWQVLPESIPYRVKDLLRRCLKKDSKKRLHDIADARLEIEELETSPIAPTAVSSDAPISRRLLLLLSVGTLVLGAAIGALALWYLKPQPPAQAVAHVAVNLPPGDQLVTAICPLAFSPDGSRLVYVATHGGVQQLFVRPLNSQEAKSLPGAEGAQSPFPTANGLVFLPAASSRRPLFPVDQCCPCATRVASEGLLGGAMTPSYSPLPLALASYGFQRPGESPRSSRYWTARRENIATAGLSSCREARYCCSQSGPVRDGMSTTLRR